MGTRLNLGKVGSGERAVRRISAADGEPHPPGPRKGSGEAGAGAVSQATDGDVLRRGLGHRKGSGADA